MTSRKRGRAEMESSEPAPEPTLLQRIRNTWEFSNLMQFIFIFGKAVKIDEDFSVEDLETECLKSGPSEKLVEIGLALLKCVSSHRGLTPEIFDEYTRRQYVAKAPEQNPFGTEDTPNRFHEFDVFTKLSVLCQLSRWTFANPDRMREKMSETGDNEQIQWRVEEIGYDKQERFYYVLDDNRLYRRTDPPLPPPPAPKPKANSKKAKAAARASKRRRTKDFQGSENDEEQDSVMDHEVQNPSGGDSFGGRTWECIAVTLTEYQDFLESIKKSRDADEKALHKRITEDVLPVIEKDEESKQRRLAKKERELMNMEKLATAKRSSRLASKFETERLEREAAEAEQKRKADITAALAHEEKQKKMEEARESRMMTREQRLKEREHKRVLHEEELAHLSEDSKKVDTGEARMSERQLKSEMEKRKKELAALDEEDTWTFDCAKCGVHGDNLDDGTHSVACENCNVWQHSACLGISQAEAEKDDFHFVCQDCKRRAEDAAKPKIPPLKFHLGSSSSPPNQKSNHAANESKKRKSVGAGSQMPPMKKFKPVEIHPPPVTSSQSGYSNTVQHGMHQTFMNGPTLSPQGQMEHEQGNSLSQPIPPPGLRSPPGPPAYTNGYTNHVNSHDGPARQTQTETPAYQSNSHPVYGNGSINDHQTATHYTPQQTPQRVLNPPQSDPNPHFNTFDRQRPVSSHGTNNPVAPTKHLSMAASPISPKNTPRFSPYTNGMSATTPNLPAALPPPVKQQTSSPPRALHPPSSSPINHPPLHNDTPSSPGFSPTKQSPPRPPPSLGLGVTPVLPPVDNLAPNSTQPVIHHPIKPLNFQQPTPTVNGHTDHE
ncbi:MAG: hypothetical protein LQ349_006440 [Xanthoria aureola]|nr:MAG: hypothetical protein LQ349_006440 [Xanthoria aureola]